MELKPLFLFAPGYEATEVENENLEARKLPVPTM